MFCLICEKGGGACLMCIRVLKTVYGLLRCPWFGFKKMRCSKAFAGVLELVKDVISSSYVFRVFRACTGFSTR